jgi:hypothetical protein
LPASDWQSGPPWSRLHGGSELRETCRGFTRAGIDYNHTADVANTRWWEQPDDPVLTTPIETCSLRIAICDRSRAGRRVPGQLNTTRAQLYPQANCCFDASRNRISAVASPPPGADPYYSLYHAVGRPVIDLFRRVRRATSPRRRKSMRPSRSPRRRASLVTSVAAATSDCAP